MGIQRPTLDQALRVAQAMRELRNVDLDDARECREDLATAIEHRLPPAVAERYRTRVRAHVAAARKWNRQLVIAMRAVRGALIERQIGKRYVPARVPVLHDELCGCSECFIKAMGGSGDRVVIADLRKVRP